DPFNCFGGLLGALGCVCVVGMRNRGKWIGIDLPERLSDFLERLLLLSRLCLPDRDGPYQHKTDGHGRSDSASQACHALAFWVPERLDRVGRTFVEPRNEPQALRIEVAHLWGVALITIEAAKVKPNLMVQFRRDDLRTEEIHWWPIIVEFSR